MAAGFQITNLAGTTLIDETYKNFRLVSTGSFSVGAGIGQSAIDYNGVNPIIAFRPQKGNFVGQTAQDYNNFGGQYYTAQTWTDSAAPSSIQYYIFDSVPDNVGTPGAVQVRDAQGRLTFDSNLKYLRLIDFKTQAPRSAPVVAGRLEAVVIATPCLQQQGGPGGYANYCVGVIADSVTGALDYSEILTASYDTSDNGQNQDVQPTFLYPTSYMIVDVTGY